MPLRVTILTPTAFPRPTGNAVSAERWRRSLARMGAEVVVLETQGLDAEGLAVRLERFRPQVIHAHHISRAGSLMLDPLLARTYGHLPVVVSPAGTDVNRKAADDEEKAMFAGICRSARSIIVQNHETADLLRRRFPDLQARIVFVPKSFMWFGFDSFDLRAAAGCREGDVLFFMPAGIRPVKGNLECLRAMKTAHDADRRIRIVFAGPAIDERYASTFREELKNCGPFAVWIPQIPQQAMHGAYQSADVILNHSESEGLSNALLEAMAAGRPILAADIPGNRWLESNRDGFGPCAHLFDARDPDVFIDQVLKFSGDAALREVFAGNGVRRAAAWPRPEQEALALMHVYEEASR